MMVLLHLRSFFKELFICAQKSISIALSFSVPFARMFLHLFPSLLQVLVFYHIIFRMYLADWIFFSVRLRLTYSVFPVVVLLLTSCSSVSVLG